MPSYNFSIKVELIMEINLLWETKVASGAKRRMSWLSLSAEHPFFLLHDRTIFHMKILALPLRIKCGCNWKDVRLNQAQLSPGLKGSVNHLERFLSNFRQFTYLENQWKLSGKRSNHHESEDLTLPVSTRRA